jgi:hypothetical protein
LPDPQINDQRPRFLRGDWTSLGVYGEAGSAFRRRRQGAALLLPSRAPPMLTVEASAGVDLAGQQQISVYVERTEGGWGTDAAADVTVGMAAPASVTLSAMPRAAA